MDTRDGSNPPRGWEATTLGVVKRYYELANRDDWDGWTDLFADDMVIDEKVPGHVEGQDASVR